MYAWEADGCKTATAPERHLHQRQLLRRDVPLRRPASPARTSPSPASDAGRRRRQQVAKKKLRVRLRAADADRPRHRLQHRRPVRQPGAEPGAHASDPGRDRHQQLSSFYCPPKASPSKCINDYGGDPQHPAAQPGCAVPDRPRPVLHPGRAVGVEPRFLDLALATTPPTCGRTGRRGRWPPTGAPASIPAGRDGRGERRSLGRLPSRVRPRPGLHRGDGHHRRRHQRHPGGEHRPERRDARRPAWPRLRHPWPRRWATAPRTRTAPITPDYTTQDANAYPMPMLTYAVVPTTEAAGRTSRRTTGRC